MHNTFDPGYNEEPDTFESRKIDDLYKPWYGAPNIFSYLRTEETVWSGHAFCDKSTKVPVETIPVKIVQDRPRTRWNDAAEKEIWTADKIVSVELAFDVQ